MSSLLGYFSFDRKKTAGSAPIREKPVRALPASWYTAPEVFELECRAIFSSRWLLLTSKLLVKAPGECLRYQFAGFDVIVTCDQEHDINVFHNKSRQSGQLIFDDGASGIGENFRCKNGWTYALNGILLEAPEYPELKSGNATHRLDRIHTKIDRNGFLWISLDTEAIPRITWEEHFKDVDVQARYKDSEFNDYVLDHTYQLECEYNWKVAADNFNEFYHCPTTHSDIPAFLNLKSFDSALAGGHTQHACQPTQEPFDAGVNVHSTYYFPNVSMTAG
jgi:phenylpropionate dioxygenase-like ring-hydroxylating dioxygenase large terminal subunit